MLALFIILVLIGIIIPAIWASYIIYKLSKLGVGKYSLNTNKEGDLDE